MLRKHEGAIKLLLGKRRLTKTHASLVQMTRRLPPLSQLRGFEAAARWSSFKRAAEELHVTQAAISRQIKALEDHLNVPLFRRMTRRVRLTPQGELLLLAVRDAFDSIADVADALCSIPQGTVLSVRFPPHLSSRWLMPRLGRFVHMHPDLDLRLSHSTAPLSFSREELDIAVHWHGENLSGITREPLIRRLRVPMCSPKLLQGCRLRKPADLRNFTLLHEFDYTDWLRWLRVAGERTVDARHGIVVDNYDVLIQAAIDGRGIALLMYPPFTDPFRTGQLTIPLGTAWSIEFIYFLYCPTTNLRRPEVSVFRNWLLEEVAGNHQEADLDSAPAVVPAGRTAVGD